MAVVYVDLEVQYALETAQEPVALEVILGDGQAGAYNVFLNRELIGGNERVNLGTASELRGKGVLVVAVIRDTLLETNWTSMTVVLLEGSRQTRFGPYTKEVPMHLDTAIFTLAILIV